MVLEERALLLPEFSNLAFEVAFFSLLGVVDTRRLAVEVAPDFLGFGELEPLKN